MPISVNALVQSSAISTTTLLTPSITPVTDRPVFIALGWRVGPSTTPTVSGCNLTWSLVRAFEGNDIMGAVFRGVGTSPTTGGVTATFGSLTTRVSASVFEVIGDVGTPVQSDEGDGLGLTSLTVNLAAFGSATNAVVGLFVVSAATPGIVPGSGFSTIHNVQAGTVLTILTQFKASADTSVDASWTGAADAVGIALELRELVFHPRRHGRVGAFEAGVGTCGLTPYRLRCTIGGVERGMQLYSFNVQHTLGQPSTCTLNTTGFPVTVGQEIRISDDGVSNLIFGGTIAKRRRVLQRDEPVFRELLCNDWTWLMNKEARIFDRFEGLPINVAVKKILAYCDPALGVRLGNVPASLGNVTVTFEGETVTEALDRIFSGVDALYEITPNKRVNGFQGENPHAQTLQLHDSTRVKALVLEDYVDQARNRVWYAGGGGATTVLVPVGSSVVPVDECGWYRSSGGFALVNGMPVTYAGVSVASGPGNLTGVSGIIRDAPLNTPVYVLAKIDDATRQTAMATLLGEGLTGVIIYYTADNRLSLAEVEGRANQHVTFYGDPLDNLTCYIDDQVLGQREWRTGRFVDVDVEDEDGEVTAGTFRISSVVIQGLGDVSSPVSAYGTHSILLERQVNMRPGARQDIVDLLVGT